MIPVKETREFGAVGSFTSQATGLDMGSLEHIYEVLRNNLYSDAKGSLIREYAVNGQDEHRKLGKTDVPIRITLPNADNLEFKVRDFGAGLFPAVYSETCLKPVAVVDNEAVLCGGNVTVENWHGTCNSCGESALNLIGGVMFYFGRYGASDKRGSNDVVGMYGLGNKSAFAYVDAFTITSYKDGRFYVHTHYLDDESKGHIALLNEGASDEPNGVEVSLSVKREDIQSFIKKTLSTVKHFDTTPEFVGLSFEPVIEKKRVIAQGTGWTYHGRGSACIVTGEIEYAVDVNSMGLGLESWERKLINSGLLIYVNIGDVQLTASREALKMSERTIKAIRARLVIVKDEMVAEMEKSFAQAKNLLEAKGLYYSMVMTGGGMGEILKDSREGFTWNGIDITDNVITLPPGHNVKLYEKTYGRRKRRNSKWKLKSTSLQKLTVESGQVIYFDDTDEKPYRYKRRVTTLFDDNGDERVILLQSVNKAALEEILGVPISDFRSFESVSETVGEVKRTNRSSTAKRFKAKQRIFRLNRTKHANFYKGTASEVWDAVDVDMDEPGIYIPIERFHPTLSGYVGLRPFYEKLKFLSSLGLNTRLPIYGVKGDENIGNLVRFDVWLRDELNKRWRWKQQHSLGLAYEDGGFLHVHRMDVDKVKDKDAKAFLILYNEARIQARTKYHSLRKQAYEMAGITQVMDTRLRQMAETFKERYPLLTLIESGSRDNELVYQYMNEMDERRSAAKLK
jgi:hypothetical protein